MPEGVIESLQENYGYDLAELPINMDVSSHEVKGCPYCGAHPNNMKDGKAKAFKKNFDGSKEDVEVELKPLDGRRVKMLSGQFVPQDNRR